MMHLLSAKTHTDKYEVCLLAVDHADKWRLVSSDEVRGEDGRELTREKHQVCKQGLEYVKMVYRCTHQYLG